MKNYSIKSKCLNKKSLERPFKILLFCVFYFLVLSFPLSPSGLAGVDKSGVKPQVISLPKGPGSIDGLGESFEPQLNSGTTTYAVKLTVQPGRAGFAPDLTLLYNGGNANSLFGMGWRLVLGHIQRQTDKGLPQYGEADTYIESGGEELVFVGNGVWRHEIEGAFMAYQREGEGWNARDRSGVLFKYGVNSESQVRKDDRIFKWLLAEKTDPNGNVIQYQYKTLGDGVRPYPDRIIYSEYGANRHEIIFHYEDRPDVLADYRPGFRVETAFRCRAVSMETNGALVRQYDFDYGEDAFVSLLASVQQTGDDGASALPPAVFTYTRFDPSSAAVNTIQAKTDGDAPPWVMMTTEPDAALNDMNADGLPDLLVARPGDHQVYLNLGVGPDGVHRWDGMTSMGYASPGEALGNDGASLADINGDGKTDFIARRSADTYFLWRNAGNGAWADAETFADNSNLAFDFENAALRLLDANNDKHIDVMYCNDASGDLYSFFINNGGAEFSQKVEKQGLGNAMTFDQRPGMKLADMNGDRLQDIVLLQDGILIYWPSSGVGEWDQTQRGGWTTGQTGTGTKMTNPPDSEMDNEPGLYNDWPNLMLVDVNGDGLTDVLYVPEGDSRVAYWLNQDGVNLSGPYDIANTPLRGWDTSVQPADMNGNGTTDLLWNYPEDGGSDQMWQYLEFFPDEKPYLLKTATNGIGRKTTFYYSTSSQECVRDRQDAPWPQGVPNPVNVLSAYMVEDGAGNSYRTEIRYHDGYFDGEEKEFRGFARAEKQEIGDASIPDLITAFRFHTGADQDALKGKPRFMETRTLDGKAFHAETYAWQTRTLAGGASGDPRSVTFAFQSSRIQDVIEKGNGALVQLKWEYEYDDYGNVVKKTEHGRMNEGWDDERVTLSSYTAGYPSGLAQWILDKAVETTVADENGTVASQKRHYYDGAQTLGEVTKGNLTRTDDWVAGDLFVTSVQNDYDAFGNVIAVYDPLYGTAPGHYRTLAYDDALKTFPVQETIYTGNNAVPTLAMSAVYDPGFGAITRSTDFNGFTTEYKYDVFGRLIAVTKPPDAGHTTEYEYVLARQLDDGRVINWVETRQRDNSPGDGFLRSRTFSDGMGRKMMTRAEGEEPGQVVVTDTVQHNARKYPHKNYLPYFETGSLDFNDPSFHTGFTEHFYDALGREIRVNQPSGPDGMLYSETARKPLAKIVKDEEQTRAGSPHFGCAMKYVEDGLQDKDGKGRLRQAIEIVRISDDGTPLAAPVEWTTAYQYDLQDKLTGYIDSQGNQKVMAYDGLGRKTFMNDPDRGQMRYAYDDAGNLVKTADAKGQIVHYVYDGVNRLTEEHYGEIKDVPDVAYHYDLPAGPLERGNLWEPDLAAVIAQAVMTPSAHIPEFDLNSDNQIDVADVVRAARNPQQTETIEALNTRGYLSWVRDLSGEEHNSYDARGRVAWVIKRLAGAGPDALTNYYSAMSYDPMDRVQTLTYPDGAFVSYVYNDRGLLESVPHIINGYDYNPSGQNALLELACGATTTYSYDHRLRLNHLKTVRSRDNLALQDLTYAFDGVSNITTITDGRDPATLDEIGGELGVGSDEARKFFATQSFVYDSLYRLTQAANPSAYGTIDYRYDRIGNMISKDADLNDPDPLMDLGAMTSGGTAGAFDRIGREPGDPPGPHAVTGTEKGPDGAMQFAYDDNGNMTSDRDMRFDWDVKDRLTGMTKGAVQSSYLYDYTNTRRKKTVTDSGSGVTTEALYIDKFSEIRNGKLIKYVYAGSNRVARMDSMASDFEELKPDMFYLHDHLGSTSFSVSAEADAVEQMVNYPFGRQRLGRRNGDAGADYRFTGKETDGESGLMYFEARYYHAVIGNFSSVDPRFEQNPLEKDKEEESKDYINHIHNPTALNYYNYCVNNPVFYKDDKGKEPILATIALGVAIGWVADKVVTAVTNKIVKSETFQYMSKGAELKGFKGALAGGAAVVFGMKDTQKRIDSLIEQSKQQNLQKTTKLFVETVIKAHSVATEKNLGKKAYTVEKAAGAFQEYAKEDIHKVTDNLIQEHQKVGYDD